MSETKFLPGIVTHTDGNGWGARVVQGEDGTTIAIIPGSPAEAKAVAERITITWNCHDALLAACEAAQALERYEWDGSGYLARQFLEYITARGFARTQGAYPLLGVHDWVRGLRDSAIAKATAAPGK